jgi:hypothetical protein
MAHTAFEHVGNCLETTVRVSWEATDIVISVGCVELIQHEERIKALNAMASEYTCHAYARSI